MKKYIILFVILIFMFVGKINAYLSYKVGEIVTYNGLDYYVIEDSDKNTSTLTLLKIETLSYEEIQKYTSGTDATISTNGGVQYGTTNEYASSYVKHVVDAWAAENTKEKDLAKDELGYSTRLLTLDEVINNFGYTFDVSATSDRYNASNDTPSWIYNTSNYWSMSSYGDSLSSVWYISRSCGTESNNSNSYLVRPVITIKKESIEDYDKIFEYNGIIFYIIKNNSNGSITMIKKDPITSNEIKDYLSSTEIASKVDITGKYAKIRYYTRDNCLTVGNQSECTAKYELSDIKQVIDVWANNYIDSKDLEKDELGYSTRLLTLDELIEDFHYEHKSGISGEWYEKTDNTPHWIRLNQDSDGIWTMTQYNDSSIQLWALNNNVIWNANISKYKAIRPVITLKRSSIDDDTKDKQEDKSASDNIKVPDTLEKKSLIIMIIGFIMLLVGLTTYYSVSKVIKERK